MKKYTDLSINDKINLKQSFINLNGKRAHFKKPNDLQKLNELQIHSLLN